MSYSFEKCCMAQLLWPGGGDHPQAGWYHPQAGVERKVNPYLAPNQAPIMRLTLIKSRWGAYFGILIQNGPLEVKKMVLGHTKALADT